MSAPLEGTSPPIHLETLTQKAPRPVDRQTPPHPRRPLPPSMVGLTLLLVVACLAGLVFYFRNDLSRTISGTRPPVVRKIAQVRHGILERTLRLTGSTEAERSVFLRAPYLRGRRSGAGEYGMILQQLLAPGKRVKKGDVVAAFDRQSMQNRADDLMASRVDYQLYAKTLEYELALTRLDHQQEVRVAKAEMDKAALDLRSAPVRSRIQAAVDRLTFEEAQATYQALLNETRSVDNSANAEYRLAELDWRMAEVEERRARTNVERMLVRAPIGGLVVATEILRGTDLARIQVGDQVRRGQPYARIVDTSSMIVDARVNQVDIERLRVGASARVHVDAYPDIELPARVHSVGPLARVSRARANFVADIPVRIKLEQKDSRLIPNLNVSVDVILASTEGAIIPRAAIYSQPGEKSMALVQTPAGWEPRPVELGLSNSIDVSVESGLRPGDIVAVGEPDRLAEESGDDARDGEEG